MASTRRIARLGTAACLASLMISSALAQDASIAAGSSEDKTPTKSANGDGVAVGPRLTIGAMGFRDGFDFSGYEGRRTLAFHVPGGAALSGAHLVLPYQAVAAGPAPRALTVMSGGRVLAQQAVTGDGTIDVPVPAEAMENGTLRATLVYSGGQSESLCLDRRAGADHLHIDAKGGLAFAFAPGASIPVAAAAALVGREPAIALPANPTPEQAAAALTVIAARGGGLLSNGVGGEAGVTIAGATDPALRSLAGGGLAIGGADPAAAARAVFSPEAELLAGSTVDTLAITPHKPKALRFADLGADTGVTDIAGDGGWTVGLPSSRLPAGQTVKGLRIDVAAVPDGAPRRAVVSAIMNGVLLGSAPLDPSGRTRLDVGVPKGLMHSLNGIEVRVTRDDREDCKEERRGWPAQLLPSSEIRLGDAGPAQDFHDFAGAAGNGLTVVVPNAQALPLAAKAVAGLVGGDVPIKVSYGQMPAEGPVLLIADSAPAGTQPKVVQQGDRLHLAAEKGGADLDIPDTGLTTVQLLDQGKRPILWIRPGRAAPLPATLWLDQGDVAFVAQDGAVSPLSTLRDRLSPPAAPEPAPWWMPQGKWLFMVIGLLTGILIVAWSFRPSVKRAKPGQSE
jgi:hypothetical protein